MFFIAQPKSGSTSLGRTLSTVLKVSYLNGRTYYPRSKRPLCNEFKEIQKYHSSMVPRSKEYIIDSCKNKKNVYKEHILPTKRHLDIIRNLDCNLMILLRKPDETFDAYKRFNEKEVLKKYGEKIVDLKQIQKDIYMFYDRYIELKKENHKHLLFITYRDIVLNFTNTFKLIFDHYNLTLPKNYKKIKLMKVKFTGVGVKRL